MLRVDFPITVFYAPSGAPLAYGYVYISLTDDALSPDGQICGNLPLKVALDGTGTMIVVPQVYPCVSLLPDDVLYSLTAYTSAGEMVSGPEFIVV